MKKTGTKCVVWKYPIPESEGPSRDKIVSLPVGSIIRHVGFDPEGVLCLWVEVDPREDRQFVRRVYVRGTGESVLLEDKGEYVGTLLSKSSTYVWHVYIGKEP